MSLILSHPNDQILKTKCNNFDFNNPPFDPIEFAQELIECMKTSNGIGLAANQVGYNFRIFCMCGEPKNFVCFNPVIIWHNNEIVTLEEGCMTYPGFIIPLKRYTSIRLRFKTPNGVTTTKIFNDLTARVVQHEICHLDGQVFWEGISRIQFERARKKCEINVSFNGNIYSIDKKIEKC